MAIYTNCALVAFPTAADWYHLFLNADDPSIGYMLTLAKYENVYVLKDLHEGAARPAWFPTQAADSTNTITRTQGTTYWYYSFNNAADWVKYTVPTDGAGCDKLVIQVFGVSGAGELDVVKNPGASEVLLGTLETDSGGTYSEWTTLTVDPLAAGDVIQFRWPSGESAISRLIGFYAYDSDGDITSFDRTFWLPSTTQIDNSGSSSVEFAYQLAPTGEAVKWTGGSAHQGGANCTEVSVTDAWYRNGSAWTAAVGYQSGVFELARASTVRYDATPTDIATNAYTYLFHPKGYGLTARTTASANLDKGNCYLGMFVDGGEGDTVRFWPGATDADITQDDGTVTSASAGQVASYKGAALGVSPLSAYMHFIPRHLTTPTTAAFLISNSGARKLYHQFVPTVTSGSVWGGAWWIEFRKTAVRQSLIDARQRLIRL